MSVIIKDIKKNNNEIIRIEVSEFKGRDLINIRVWYQAISGGSGDITYKPTQKGITINVSEFAELKDGVIKLENYLNDLKKGTVPEQPLDKSHTIVEEEDSEEDK